MERTANSRVAADAERARAARSTTAETTTAGEPAGAVDTATLVKQLKDPIAADAAAAELASRAATGDGAALEGLRRALRFNSKLSEDGADRAAAALASMEVTESDISILYRHLVPDSRAYAVVEARIASAEAVWFEPARAALAELASTDVHTGKQTLIGILVQYPGLFDDSAALELLAANRRSSNSNYVRWLRTCAAAPGMPARVLEQLIACADELEAIDNHTREEYFLLGVLREHLAGKYADDAYFDTYDPGREHGSEHNQEAQRRGNLRSDLARYAVAHSDDPEVVKRAAASSGRALGRQNLESLDAVIRRALSGDESAEVAANTLTETIASFWGDPLGPQVVDRLLAELDGPAWSPRTLELLGRVGAALHLVKPQNSSDDHTRANRAALERLQTALRERASSSNPAVAGAALGGMAALAGEIDPAAGENAQGKRQTRLDAAGLTAALCSSDERATEVLSSVVGSAGISDPGVLSAIVDALELMSIDAWLAHGHTIPTLIARPLSPAQFRRVAAVMKRHYALRTSGWLLEVVQVAADLDTRLAAFELLRDNGYMRDDRALIAMAQLTGESAHEAARKAGDPKTDPGLRAARARQSWVHGHGSPPVGQAELQQVQGVASDLLSAEIKRAREAKDDGDDSEQVNALVELGDWLTVLAIARKPEWADQVDCDKARRHIEHLTGTRLKNLVKDKQEQALADTNFEGNAAEQIHFLTEDPQFVALFLSRAPSEQPAFLAHELMKLQMAAPGQAEQVQLQTLRRLIGESAKLKVAIGEKRFETGDFTAEELELSLAQSGVPDDLVKDVLKYAKKTNKAIGLGLKTNKLLKGSSDTSATDGGPKPAKLGGLKSLASFGLSGVSLGLSIAKEDWWNVALDGADTVKATGDIATSLLGVSDKLLLIKALGFLGVATDVITAFTTMNKAERDREMGDWKGAGFKAVQAYAGIAGALGSSLVLLGVASGGWLVLAALAVGLAAWLLDNMYGESEEESLLRKMGVILGERPGDRGHLGAVKPPPFVVRTDN